MLAYSKGHIYATDYAHSVIRIRLKNGESYVIDMTGAQYGWYETTTPWDIYERNRVLSIKGVHPFGYNRHVCTNKAEELGGQAKWYHDADATFSRALDDIAAGWQQGNLSLGTMLKLPDVEFGKEQAAFLESLEGSLQKFKDDLMDKGALDIQDDIVTGGLDRKVD